jgi:hypothetical protein
MKNNTYFEELEVIKKELIILKNSFIELQKETPFIKEAIKNQQYDLAAKQQVKQRELYNKLKIVQIQYNSIKRVAEIEYRNEIGEIELLINWFL